MSNNTLLCAAVRFSVFKDGMRKRIFKSLAAVAASSPVFAMAADDLAGIAIRRQKVPRRSRKTSWSSRRCSVWSS
jgi:hypothetical protein